MFMAASAVLARRMYFMNAGNAVAARMPMMATTIISSISVNPRSRSFFMSLLLPKERNGHLAILGRGLRQDDLLRIGYDDGAGALHASAVERVLHLLFARLFRNAEPAAIGQHQRHALAGSLGPLGGNFRRDVGRRQRADGAAAERVDARADACQDRGGHNVDREPTLFLLGDRFATGDDN